MKTRNYALLSLLAMAACAAQPVCAQETSNAVVRTAIITESSCELVAQSESVAGGAVGGGIGAAAGGILTGLVFGRDYAPIGSFVGGLTGTAVGANAGSSRTYSCLVKARTTDGDIYVETTGRLRNVGQSLILVKAQDGTWLVRP